MTKAYGPKWKCITQLGDLNPIDHGGQWVLIDTAALYSPEMEILEVIGIDDHTTLYRRATVLLDRCTYINGVLSDNCHHPELPAWYADQISAAAFCMDYHDPQELIDLLCSSDPINVALGYRDLVDYFGIEEFGGYDQTEMTRAECRKRYAGAMYKIK